MQQVPQPPISKSMLSYSDAPFSKNISTPSSESTNRPRNTVKYHPSPSRLTSRIHAIKDTLSIDS